MVFIQRLHHSTSKEIRTFIQKDVEGNYCLCNSLKRVDTMCVNIYQNRPK